MISGAKVSMLAKGKVKALMSGGKVESEFTIGVVCGAFGVAQSFSTEEPCD